MSLDAIGRQFDDADFIPESNGAWSTANAPLRILAQAAGLANARGI